MTATYSAICTVEGCNRLRNGHGARGMCRAHYQRWWRNGEPGSPKIGTPTGEDHPRYKHLIQTEDGWKAVPTSQLGKA